jgi:hypothetical protein
LFQGTPREDKGKRELTTDGDAAWLVDASYAAGQVSLRFIKAGDLEPIHWIDLFQPYYLTEDEQRGEPVRKLNLFTQNELTLQGELRQEASKGYPCMGVGDRSSA